MAPAHDINLPTGYLSAARFDVVSDNLRAQVSMVASDYLGSPYGDLFRVALNDPSGIIQLSTLEWSWRLLGGERNNDGVIFPRTILFYSDYRYGEQIGGIAALESPVGHSGSVAFSATLATSPADTPLTLISLEAEGHEFGRLVVTLPGVGDRSTAASRCPLYLEFKQPSSEAGGGVPAVLYLRAVRGASTNELIAEHVPAGTYELRLASPDTQIYLPRVRDDPISVIIQDGIETEVTIECAEYGCLELVLLDTHGEAYSGPLVLEVLRDGGGGRMRSLTPVSLTFAGSPYLIDFLPPGDLSLIPLGKRLVPFDPMRGYFPFQIFAGEISSLVLQLDGD